MGNALHLVLGELMAFLAAAFGRWVYTHPKLFIDKLYKDLDLLKPTGTLGKFAARFFGLLVAFCGVYLGVGLFCGLIFRGFKFELDWGPLIVSILLSIPVAWYLLRGPSPEPQK